MTSKVHYPLVVRIVPVLQADLTVRLFVWAVWFFMVLVALVALARYGRNIPLAEDWLLVAPLTGHESDLIKWLWAQNNEHRIPFPKLILFGLLKLTQGDFRVGMVFNVLSLGLLAWGMIRVAQSLRGGRASYVDAFFPIALLHLGNWENLIWSWQLTQVLPTILTCVILLVLVRYQSVTTPVAAIMVGICLVLLPLSGANGLVFVPFLALWLSYCAALHWRAAKMKGQPRWVSLFLWGSAVTALAFTCLYFVGYERPYWNPPSPGIGASLVTTVQFVALSIGPIARYHWLPAATAVIVILLLSAVIIISGVLRAKVPERQRSLALLVFFGNVAAFALAMGWGRSGVIAVDGNWPLRYVLMGAPTLCTAFFIWELYGPTKLRIIFQGALFLGMCLLLPLNTIQGLTWRSWYDEGMTALEADIAADVSHTVLAERYQRFLIHWWDPPRLADNIKMLHDAQMGPFAYVQMESIDAGNLLPCTTLVKTQSHITRTSRYHLPVNTLIPLTWHSSERIDTVGMTSFPRRCSVTSQ